MKRLPLSCENHSITSLCSLGYLGVKLPIVACFADNLKKAIVYEAACFCGDEINNSDEKDTITESIVVFAVVW